MYNLPEILTSPDLNPRERRRYRLPLAIAAGTFLSLSTYVTAQYGDALLSSISASQETDHGCADIVVQDGDTVTRNALKAIDALNLPTDDANLRAAVSGSAIATEHNVIQPGDTVRTCIGRNTMQLMDGGWHASITVALLP
jgi:hypothetical protein